MKFSLIEYIVLGAFVLMASLSHSLAKLQEARSDVGVRSFTHADFLIAFLIANFAGALFGISALYFFDSHIPVIIFASVGGFLGLDGLRKVTEAFRDVLLNLITKK